MECKFCQEVWHTAGRKGTKSRFSLIATLLWAFWALVILLAACKALDFLGMGFSGSKENPVKNSSVIVVPQEVANGIGSGDESSKESDSKADEPGAQEAAPESGESAAPSDSK